MCHYFCYIVDLAVRTVMSQQQEKQEDKLDTKLRDDFGPELHKIAKALSVVVGFESIGDYVPTAFVKPNRFITSYFL